MRRRWTAEEITRLLKEADRDLTKGLTVSHICRKHGIGQSMYYRWRQKCDLELELEVDRLKKLVAELLLDKTMLQDVAKKSGKPGPTASRRRLLERAGTFEKVYNIQPRARPGNQLVRRTRSSGHEPPTTVTRSSSTPVDRCLNCPV